MKSITDTETLYGCIRFDIGLFNASTKGWEQTTTMDGSLGCPDGP